jgi:glycogen operon protein
MTPAGVNFALHASTATAVWQVVWPGGRGGERRDMALDARTHRSGDVWHVELAGLTPPLQWAWRVDRPAATAGPPADVHQLLLDP